MPANTSPIYVSSFNAIPIGLTGATAASDGSGTLTTIVTAGTNGTRVDEVLFINGQATEAATSARLGKIFLTDASGNNPYIIGEITLPATTRGAYAPGDNNSFTFSPPLLMKSGQLLKVSISVYGGTQDNTSVLAITGDF